MNIKTGAVGVKATEKAFTFAELLAAMVLVGVLLPVVTQGLLLANRAGAVAKEKTNAAQWAENYLNELVVTGEYLQVGSFGSVQVENRTYDWRLMTEDWGETTTLLIELNVQYKVQGRNYNVVMTTLARPDA